MRERSAWAARAGKLAGDAGPDGLTVAMIDRAIANGDEVGVVDAAFLAGRCDTGDQADLRHFEGLLRRVIDRRPVDRLRAQAAAYVEAAMSLALLTGPEVGRPLLLPLVSGDGLQSTRGYLAAAYLAQLGDPSGYPAMVVALESDTTQTRLMAARNLISFVDHDGRPVGDLVVDLRGLFGALLDDPDPFVSREIPALMAEAGVAA